MPPATVADLAVHLERYGLLLPEQHEELPRLAATCAGARPLAGELIRRGWLTPFQVNHLFQGRGGELELGSYLLLERLGEGGMGEVFKARHRKLGRVVALKVIRKDRLGDETHVRRFQREIRAGAQLDNAHVVLALDAGQEGDTHFFTMEYVEGTDLKKVVRQRGPLPVAEACEYVRQAALGLQHAHERGLVHRDVKPSNLLVTPAGQVKVLDLGLARLETWVEAAATSELTHEGAIMGTFDYIAPEQAEDSRRVDVRSDLYALGCTFYYLLTGRVPFPGGSYMDKLARHRTEAPTPVEQLQPDVPPAVAGVVRTLMAKRPEDRYQTPRELAEALAAILRGAPARRQSGAAAEVTTPFADLGPEAPHPDVGPGPRGGGSRSRRMWVVGGGAGAALLAALVVAALLLAGRRGGGGPGPGPAPAARAPGEEEQAQAVLQELLARPAAAAAEKDDLRQGLLDLRRAHPGTRAAVTAALRLRDLPSPLDRLDPARIPPEEVCAGQPRQLVALLGGNRGRHWDGLTRVAFLPDGRLFTVDHGGVIRRWDGATLAERAMRQGPARGTAAAALAADGRTALFVDAVTQSVQVVDPEQGTLLRTLEGGGGCQGVALSGDGLLALGAVGNGIRLWDVGTGKERPRPAERHTAPVNCVALSGDARRALSGGEDGTVRLWDLAGGREVHCFAGHTGPVRCVALVAGGRYALSGGDDTTVRLWDLETGKEVRRFEGHTERVVSLAVTGEGHRALSGDRDFTARLWDLESGREIGRLQGHRSIVNDVAFSADGRRALTGGEEGVVRLWDLTGPTPREAVTVGGHQGLTQWVGFAPDGRVVATGGRDCAVQAWDVSGAAPRDLGSVHGFRGTWAPEGQVLVTADDAGGLLRGVVGADGLKLRGPAFGQANGGTAQAVSPDGRTLVSGGGSPEVWFWDLPAGDGQPGVRFRVPGPVPPDGGLAVRFAVFSPDGRTLALGSDDGRVHLWDPNAVPPREVASLGPPGAGPLAYSPNGKTLAVGVRTAVDVWDVGGPVPVRRTTITHGEPIRAVVFAPDGTLATSEGLGRITIWNLADPSHSRTLQLPGAVNHLAFSPDSRHLATANANGTAYILRLAPPAP